MPDLLEELSRLEGQLEPARQSVIDELAKVRTDLGSAPDRKGPVRLANLRIASPCKERWSGMTGDERVRVCNGCERPVFNLSAMTQEEAEAVLATRGVTPCVRFYRRSDGTVMTADCAPGARRRVRIAAVAAGTLLFGASPAMADPLAAPPAAESHGITGAIEGVVKDQATGEAAVGATVVITGPDGVAESAITDESGYYKVVALPPGVYVATFYYADNSVERKDITVAADQTTPVSIAMKTDPSGTIIIENTFTMGLPPDNTSYGATLSSDYTEEEGVIVTNPEPEHRPVIEWSTWARIGIGTASQPTGALARSIVPQPSTERHTTLEAALGADLTLPIALHGDLRVGAWTEVRTSSGPVLGGELQLQAVPHHLHLFQYDGEGILSLRAGGNPHVVTGAIAYGYLAPWKLWGPWRGKTRYMIGVRLVASATRSLDDPRDWSATAGLEFEPVGALRYVLGIRSWY